MIEATFAFVPPGGGESDYSMETKLEVLPNVGDYILSLREGDQGYETFIVRRLKWYFRNNDGNASMQGVTIECEFARHHDMSEAHKAACNRYALHYTVQEMEVSGF
jgi:hypothetical protein